MIDLLEIKADTFFGIAIAEGFSQSVVDARATATKYSKVADALSKIAESGDQASWRNCAADLKNNARGNFVRR